MHFFVALFIATVIGIYIYRKIAIKINILDIPNERSSHSIPTPRGAGSVVAGVWFVALGYMYFVGDTISSPLFYALFSGIILAAVGIVDDIWDISPKIRLLAQIISASLALYFLGGLSKVDFGIFSINNIWVLTVLAFIAIIWFINVFNFLDGIDGYLGTEVLFISLFTSIYYNNAYALIMVSVILGFLIFNWPKAKIFMGDVGSTLLGFNLAVLAIYFQNTDTSSLILWVILSSVFWFDATLTLIRRIRNKEQLLTAHRKHAYQRILMAGYSNKKILIYLIIINLVILGFVLISLSFKETILPVLMSNVLFLYFIDRKISSKNPFK